MIAKASCHVPAAAHTSWYSSRSGSTKILRLVAKPIGGTRGAGHAAPVCAGSSPLCPRRRGTASQTQPAGRSLVEPPTGRRGARALPTRLLATPTHVRAVFGSDTFSPLPQDAMQVVMPIVYSEVSPKIWDDRIRRCTTPARCLRGYIATCPIKTSERLFQLPPGICDDGHRPSTRRRGVCPRGTPSGGNHQLGSRTRDRARPSFIRGPRPQERFEQPKQGRNQATSVPGFHPSMGRPPASRQERCARPLRCGHVDPLTGCGQSVPH